MRKLISLLGIDNNSERPTRESAVEMIAGSPDEIAGVFETARQEIEKLKQQALELQEEVERLEHLPCDCPPCECDVYTEEIE